MCLFDKEKGHVNTFIAALNNTSLCIDYPEERCNIKVIIFGSMLSNLKGH